MYVHAAGSKTHFGSQGGREGITEHYVAQAGERTVFNVDGAPLRAVVVVTVKDREGLACFVEHVLAVVTLEGREVDEVLHEVEDFLDDM